MFHTLWLAALTTMTEHVFGDRLLRVSRVSAR